MILDSNVIIYSNQARYAPLIEWLNRPGITFSASVISQLEVLGFHKLTLSDKEDFEDLFSNTPPHSITSNIIQLAITLRKRSLGDAIIAATALIHGLPVVTNNVSDFSTVDGLTVISLASILDGSAV